MGLGCPYLRHEPDAVQLPTHEGQDLQCKDQEVHARDGDEGAEEAEAHVTACRNRDRRLVVKGLGVKD